MSLQYEVRKNEYGDVIGCDSCRVEVATTQVAKPAGGQPPTTSLLCSLCASTFIGNAHQYPNNYSFVTPEMLAQAIHWLKKELSNETF